MIDDHGIPCDTKLLSILFSSIQESLLLLHSAHMSHLPSHFLPNWLLESLLIYVRVYSAIGGGKGGGGKALDTHVQMYLMNKPTKLNLSK